MDYDTISDKEERPPSAPMSSDEAVLLRRMLTNVLERLPPPAPVTLPTSTIPRTPTSLSSPPLPTIPDSVRPSSTVTRPLFRDPLPAPAAPQMSELPFSPSLATPPVPDSPAAVVGFRSRSVKVPAPEKFGGSTKDKAQARGWLLSVKRWLELTTAGDTDHFRVLMFATLLKDSALSWFNNMQTRADAKRAELTLQQVFDKFVETYEGSVTVKISEGKLNTLVYGKGECKDLAATDSEFDRLTQEVYPGWEDQLVARQMLGETYSGIIQRGDFVLWEKAMDLQPTTVDEWKAAVQTAYSILEKKKAAVARGEGRTSYHSKHSSAFSPSTATPRATATVKLQQTQATAIKDRATTEREEGEPEENDEEELAKADASRSPRLGDHLTFAHRQSLMRLGKCWNCIQKGHIAKECPQQGKPGYPRKPTKDDLKA